MPPTPVYDRERAVCAGSQVKLETTAFFAVCIQFFGCGNDAPETVPFSGFDVPGKQMPLKTVLFDLQDVKAKVVAKPDPSFLVAQVGAPQKIHLIVVGKFPGSQYPPDRVYQLFVDDHQSLRSEWHNECWKGITITR